MLRLLIRFLPENMQRSIRSAQRLLFGVIGVGLLLGGAWMYYQTVPRLMAEGMSEALVPNLLAGGIMLLVGGAFLYNAIRQHGLSEEYDTSDMDEPWTAREAWQTPVFTHTGSSGPWIFAVLLLVGGGALAGAFIWNEIIQATTPEWPVLLVLLFPLFGVLLAYQSYKAYKRRQRFGTSEMEMETMPARLGTRMLAEVRARLPRSEFPEHGVQVQLSCYRRTVHRETTTDSDGDRKTKLKEKKRLLWRGEKQMRARTYNGDQACIPVSFEMPAELPESTAKKRPKKYLARTGKADTIWKVSVRAEIPGVDYEATFEIPVYAAEDDERDAASASAESDMGDATAGMAPAGDGASEKVMWDLERDEEALSVGTGEDEAASDDPYAEYEVKPDLDAPISKHISVEQAGSRGVRIHVAPDRSLKGMASTVLVGLFGIGMTAGSIFVFGQNLIVGLILLVFGVLCLWGAWTMAMQETTITVADGNVSVKQGSISTKETSFPATEVEDIRVIIDGTSTSSNYQLVVQRHSTGTGVDGSTAEGIADTMGQVFGEEATAQMKEKMSEAQNRAAHLQGLHNKHEADWIAQQLRDAVEAEKRYA